MILNKIKRIITKLGTPYSNCTKSGKLAFYEKYTEEHCKNECTINRSMVKKNINLSQNLNFDHRKELWLFATAKVLKYVSKKNIYNAEFLAPFFPDKIPSGLYRNCSLFVEVTKNRERKK